MPPLWSRWLFHLLLAMHLLASAPLVLAGNASDDAAQDVPAGRAESPSLKSLPAHSNVLLAFLVSLEQGSQDFISTAKTFAGEVRLEISNSSGLVDSLSNHRGRDHFLRFLATLGGIILCSLLAFKIAGRALHRLVRGSMPTGQGPGVGSFAALLGRFLCSALSLAVFFAVFFVLLMSAIPGPSPERTMGGIVFVALTYALVLQVFARALLTPSSAGFRLLPVGDDAAKSLYRWLMAITWLAAALGACSIILEHVGGATSLGKVLYASAGVSTGLLLCAMILANKRRVAEALSADGGEHNVLTLLARHWHYPAMAYALSIGVFWSVRALSVEEPLVRLVLGMFLIPVCIGLDFWVRRLLEMASRDEPVAFSLNADADEDGPAPAGDRFRQLPQRKGLKKYYPLILKALRVALIVFAIFLMFRVWGVEIPVGWLFARDILGILFVGVACLVIWEVISIRIDRQLQEEMALSGVNAEEMDEGGGAGGSRKATLLVLLRKFMMAVLVVMGTLMGLSALGVDIAPLIAGAGVVGLAIGFGAQTLVKDILSGIFFLIDDAFRVGDYVETGSAKGTVEHISLRSMRLRHPRGMIYTVPFGGLKILQNYSRDYIVTKLDFRIRYDADIEKIRKVIKRVNKDIQADESLKNGLLSDIKSNGVRGMEDSAMILRVKFKTVPGHQFVTRKEVYRRIQEAFHKNGIEFAHRNVTVYLPPEVQSLLAANGAGDKSVAGSAIGAAAAATIMQEEERARAAAEAAARAKSAE
ncbi:Small-conductance mechanosensitive channel [Desulfomicrobium norvegicum]|uniref:Small-conductance mechanosensitive channel n=1 Tax=Desulfomicrobium norvegicum (strain DSM 1741 / NCIMB 8310) TaxID=52561 RepID=A0A8G2C3D3_DESNO|nr:mechanosensitive ion channel family protein [Desulfomicrobium norvegicum]SFL79687.1 Small-conductance mechanosensitive channel [Desulfomicrobium norvegicum]